MKQKLLLSILIVLLAIAPSCATNDPAYVYVTNPLGVIGYGGPVNWLGDLSGAPENSTLADVYHNTTDGTTYFYNSTAWVTMAESGADGSTGPQGIQGIQGPQGIQGGQGIQGETGAAGPNQVTTTTSTDLTGILVGNGTYTSSITDNSANWDTAYGWGNHTLAGYLLIADIDDAPVDGVTNAPISSNWAFDHVAAADPHTGYVLESASGLSSSGNLDFYPNGEADDGFRMSVTANRVLFAPIGGYLVLGADGTPGSAVANAQAMGIGYCG